MIGKKGKDLITIPVPSIDIPHFRYGHKDQGGVGQGDGEPGTVLAPGAVEGDGHGKAGQGEGQHALEVDLSLDELAEILGEELALPRIQNKGKKNLVTPKVKYSGVHTTGPESLRHFKRTYKQALKRSIASGTYNPAMPIIVPTREDKRYRSWRVQEMPQSNAVVIYMMDVSGSMGDEQKEIVRIESFWIDTWLRVNYKGLATRYIIHDAVAREVDRGRYAHLRQPAQGGDPPQGDPVRLRPGGEPLRERPVHQGPARGLRRGGERGPLGDQQQGRHLQLDQGLPREGELA